MKVVTPFESLSLWAQSPWWFINMSLRFVQSWQDECYARLRLLPGVVPVAPVRPAPGAGNEVKRLKDEIAAKQGRVNPALGCLQGVVVVGGPAVEAAAAPVVVDSPAVMPALPEATPTADELPAAGASVTSMLAMQAKSLAKAVKRGATDVAVPAKPARKPAARAAAKPARKVSEKA